MQASHLPVRLFFRIRLARYPNSDGIFILNVLTRACEHVFEDD
jgi:hypothetical protein